MPETPSIITSRASCSVSPTSAIGDSLSFSEGIRRDPLRDRRVPIRRRRGSCPRRGRTASAMSSRVVRVLVRRELVVDATAARSRARNSRKPARSRLASSVCRCCPSNCFNAARKLATKLVDLSGVIVIHFRRRSGVCRFALRRACSRAASRSLRSRSVLTSTAMVRALLSSGSGDAFSRFSSVRACMLADRHKRDTSFSRSVLFRRVGERRSTAGSIRLAVHARPAVEPTYKR